jgi:hypothetical protein
LPDARKPLSLRRIAIILGAALVLGILIWPLFRARVIGPRISSVVPQRAAAAQITASAFPFADLGDSAEFERAAETLIAAEAARRAEPTDPNDWPAALRLSLDFLRVCASADAARYEAWALNTQQLVIVPEFPAWGPYTRDVYAERYQQVIGHVMPRDIRPDEYFKQYFEAYWKRGGGELRPVAIAIDPQAIDVKSQVFIHWGDSFGPNTRKDGLGPLFWVGGITTGSMMLHWPSRVFDGSEAGNFQKVVTGGTFHDVLRLFRESMIREHQAINAVRIFFVYRGESGIFVPVNFVMIQRPADGVWEIHHFGISNVGADAGIGTEDLAQPIL